MWGCVFSVLPISLVMIGRICIICLIIIIKSEVWTIIHYLGLGHETRVCALYVSLYYINIIIFFVIGDFGCRFNPTRYIVLASWAFSHRLHFVVSMTKSLCPFTFNERFMTPWSKSYKNACCSYIWKIIVQSAHNFAHVMITQLYWHVQNCGLIDSLVWKLKKDGSARFFFC